MEPLWLAMLQRLAGRAAHELRNPLNGAMLNVEVVRQRVQRAAVDAPAVAPFAEAAASELGRAAELVDALLTLARPARAPIDLADVLEPLVTLYGAMAASHGGRVTLVRPRDEGFETTSSADLVRCVLASALDLTRGDPTVRCALAACGDATAVDVQCTERDLVLEAPVLAAMRYEGIEHSELPHGIVILFPRHGRDRTRDAS